MFQHKDKQYWINKFYEGTLLVPGWITIKKQILEITPDEERENITALIDRLGEKISDEWAKLNEQRQISGTELKQWASSLKSAQKKEFSLLKQTLKNIEQEVDGLLS